MNSTEILSTLDQFEHCSGEVRYQLLRHCLKDRLFATVVRATLSPLVHFGFVPRVNRTARTPDALTPELLAQVLQLTPAADEQTRAFVQAHIDGMSSSDQILIEGVALKTLEPACISALEVNTHFPGLIPRIRRMEPVPFDDSLVDPDPLWVAPLIEGKWCLVFVNASRAVAVDVGGQWVDLTTDSGLAKVRETLNREFGATFRTPSVVEGVLEPNGRFHAYDLIPSGEFFAHTRSLSFRSRQVAMTAAFAGSSNRYLTAACGFWATTPRDLAAACTQALVYQPYRRYTSGPSSALMLLGEPA